MALTKGPLFSFDATGSVAKTITFSKWKGRNYVRRLVKPSQPRSGAQVGRRAMFKFLAQQWVSQGGASQATWKTLADQIVASYFNAYMKHNLERWHNYLSPITDYPATEEGTGSDNVLTGAVWEENRIKLTLQGTALDTAWGIVIFGALGAALTPSVGTAVLVRPDETFAEHFEYFTPHEGDVNDQWTFDSQSFSNDGVLAAAGGPQST